MNAFNQNAAEVRNKGQIFNIGNAQDAANRNVIASNQAKYSNQNRTDNILNDAYNRNFNERNFQNKTATDQYNLKAGEIGRRNSITGQTYQDKMGNAAAKAGVGYTGIDMMNTFARDQNQAIQGLAKGVGDTAMTAGYLSNPTPKANVNPTETKAPSNSDRDLYDTVEGGYKVRSPYYKSFDR